MANKFIDLLLRNFPEGSYVAIGENWKFLNDKKGELSFGRDFNTYFMKPPYVGEYLKNRMKKGKDFGDLYISFTPISEKKRLKANALDTFIVAMDIDGVKIPEDFPPSYFWETSLNKYQGVWILDNKLTPEEQETINRKMVAKYGFDPCSADIVHFYRIPGSKNHKYANTFKVGKMQGEGTVYRKRDLEKHLKDVEVTTVAIFNDDPIEDLDNVLIDDLLAEYHIQKEFKQVMAIDRSQWAWNIEKKMIEAGATKAEVKFVLLSAPEEVAKFDERTVINEVHRAFSKIEDKTDEEKKEFEQVSLNRLTHKGNKKPRAGAPINIVQYSDIEDYDPENAWLVEDLWANESVGVIGAPSKSFKSTLTLNLACAVATGRDFDGRRTQQGAVLIIQGENALSMEKHKIKKITGLDNAPIYFVQDNITLENTYRLEAFIEKNEVKLLIIDPMYLLFGSGDINKHQDITLRLQMLTKIRDNTGCSVMLVHHSRKLERGATITTSDMYGSSFIEGWYESMILLQRAGSNSSNVVTFFRNHQSGRKYTLVVDEDMKCSLLEESHSDETEDINEMPFGAVNVRKNKKDS